MNSSIISNNFYNYIKKSSFCKKSKIINDLFNKILNEKDDNFCYKELIYNNMLNSKYRKIKFGKYFKENKGIYNNINKIYFYKYNQDENKDNIFCCIFSIKIYEYNFYCYLEINSNDGCSTCYMDKYQDNKLFINDTLENLIIYDVPNNKIFQYY